MSTPHNPKSPRGQAFGTPLAVIAALIGVVEAAFAYPVTKLSGSNQTIFVAFMVAFPFALLVGLFLMLWFRPAHLYAPKDFKADRAFLDAIGRTQPAAAVAAAPPESVGTELPRERLGASGGTQNEQRAEPVAHGSPARQR